MKALRSSGSILGQRATLSTYRNTKYAANIITDTINKYTSKKADETKEKYFSDMISLMIKHEKWSFRPWKQVMENQLNSWMMYIPGVSSSKEASELKGFKDMLDAMTEEELDHPERINGKARERISATSKKSLDDVRMLLYIHKQTQIVQQWIRIKHQAGEAMPQDDWEMQKMMEKDRRVPGIAASIMQSGGRKPKVPRF